MNVAEIAATCGTDYRAADVVVLDRLLGPDVSLESAEQLVERARADRVCLIYHLDDNLLDLCNESPFRRSIDTPQKMIVRYLARQADGLIVSTDPLKERMSRLNPNITVVPNAIDERLLSASEPVAPAPADRRREKVMGFMGTFTHDGDIMMVVQALRAVLRRHAGDLALEFVGGFVDPSILELCRGLPVRGVDASADSEYPAFVRWMFQNIKWDIAIAPLSDTRFTRCKSDIKFLDYGALGIAGIYSKVEPYQGTVRHLETGYLAPNSVSAWGQALELLLNDDRLRNHIAHRARDYVFSKRTLACCATLWREAIVGFMAPKGRATSRG